MAQITTTVRVTLANGEHTDYPPGGYTIGANGVLTITIPADAHDGERTLNYSPSAWTSVHEIRPLGLTALAPLNSAPWPPSPPPLGGRLP